MKKFNKLILSVLAVLAFALVLKAPVSASSYFYQTGAAVDHVDVAWSTYYGTTISSVTSLTTSDGMYSGTISGNRGTLWLPAGYQGTAKLSFKYKTVSGRYIYTYSATMTCSVSTLPQAPGVSNFILSSLGSNYAYFEATRPSNAKGCQIELYNGWNGVGSDTFFSYSGSFAIARGNLYRYRLRYYVEVDGNRFYSEWSPFRCFAPINSKSICKSNKKGIKLTVYKAAGVTNYNVYISKSSRTAGFRKVATVKIGGRSKTVMLKKGYAKKRINYIKIAPVIPGYGESDSYGIISQYVYK